MYRMKFVCLLHESELQVTELTEYKGTYTLIRHTIYINYSDTYLHHIATTGSVSCQLIGRKSNPIFLPVKLPYRRHSSLNTTSR